MLRDTILKHPFANTDGTLTVDSDILAFTAVCRYPVVDNITLGDLHSEPTLYSNENYAQVAGPPNTHTTASPTGVYFSE